MLICYWLFIAQIVAESFPISSSTHVILLEHILSKNLLLETAMHETACSILMHGVHLSAVIVSALFLYPQGSFLLRHWRRCRFIIAKIIGFGFLTDSVTALLYLLIHDTPFALGWYGIGLCITTMLLFSSRWATASARSPWTWYKALILGLVQGLALLPGISRLASTYVIACWLGLSARRALQLSLLVQWPLIAAASARGIYHSLSTPITDHFMNVPMLFGMALATLIAWYGLRLVAWMAYRTKVWLFSFYMIIPFAIWAWLMFHKYLVF